MLRKYALYLLLGVVTAMFISPVLLDWLGIPSPGQRIASLITVVFGELNGFTTVLTILVSGVFIVLILIGSIKLAKKLDQSA